jgi:hypothetical protein
VVGGQVEKLVANAPAAGTRQNKRFW